MGRTAHITCSRRAPAFLCRLLWFRKSAMREHPGAPLLRSSNFCFCALICGDNSNLAACRKGAWRQNGDKKSNVLFCSHLTVDAGVSSRKSPPSADVGRGANDGVACRCHEEGTAIVRESVRSGCARLASRAARTRSLHQIRKMASERTFGLQLPTGPIAQPDNSCHQRRNVNENATDRARWSTA